jgi:hypothetical protein
LLLINNLFRNECGEPLYDKDEHCIFNTNTYNLQRLLLVLAKITYKDEYDDKKSCINVTGLIFKDEPFSIDQP